MIWMIKLSLLFNSSPSKTKSDPKIFPDAPALLQPLQAPPARLFTSSLLPAGLLDGKGWGDLLPSL